MFDAVDAAETEEEYKNAVSEKDKSARYYEKIESHLEKLINHSESKDVIVSAMGEFSQLITELSLQATDNSGHGRVCEMLDRISTTLVAVEMLIKIFEISDEELSRGIQNQVAKKLYRAGI